MAPRTLLLALAVLASLQLASADEPKWSLCAPSRYFNTSKVDIMPFPPQAGQDLNFKIWGTTALVVNAGIINVDISYMGMHIFSEVKNLCDKTDCPIPAVQELQLTYVESLPGFIPPGDYNMKITVTSVDGEQNTQLFCMDVDVSITSSVGLKKLPGIRKHSSSIEPHPTDTA